MNKNERRKLKTAARRYCNTTMQALQEFSCIIDDFKENEEEKLENLPESLVNSTQSVNITEAIDMLDEIMENFDSIESACDMIADITDINIEYTEPSGHFEASDTGLRKNRVQILLSDHLLSIIRMEAAAEGCSHNEVICRALTKELIHRLPK